MTAKIRDDHSSPTTIGVTKSTLAHAHDHGLSHGHVTVAISDEELGDALAEAVLAGDHERATEIALAMQGRATKRAAQR